MKISPLLEGKGLISFEEITDYSLLDEKLVKQISIKDLYLIKAFIFCLAKKKEAKKYRQK